MGKSYQGILGNFSGKVGNVVGRIRQGRTIYSVYQPMVANPRTDDQVAARNKFAMMVECLKSFSGFLKTSFRSLDGYKTGNPFSSAVGYNLRNGVVSGTPLDINYAQTVVSVGGVDKPYSPSAAADGTTLTVTWADNSGMGNAQATDKIMVLAYNTDKKDAVYNTSLADRATRNATMALPTAWSGDSVEVWLAVVRPSTGDCSMSTHLATLPL